MQIRDYKDLERIGMEWDGERCIFGAGKVGRGYGYDLLLCAGVSVDYYVDNNISEEKIIHNGIKTKSVEYLYENSTRVFVFVCVSAEPSYEIEDQLVQHGVSNYALINWYTFGRIMESIDQASDEVKKRYYEVYDNKTYITKHYECITGMKLNIDEPRLFNEKLQWIKLHLYDNSYSKYVDKLAFKKLVAERYGDDYTIPHLGTWDAYEDIDFSTLPESFVLKCTHDSGSIEVIKNKQEIDHRSNKRKFADVLGTNYYWLGREWPYRGAQRKIIAEKYVEDEYKELRDYKFFCFNGQVKLIQVDFDRFTSHKRNVYDTNWNYIPLTIKYPTASEVIIPSPACLDKMIEIAEDLSHGIIHVRVDFYVIDNHPIVGEMTFFHGGGMERFDPISWNYRLGDYIVLPKN